MKVLLIGILGLTSLCSMAQSPAIPTVNGDEVVSCDIYDSTKTKRLSIVDKPEAFENCMALPEDIALDASIRVKARQELKLKEMKKECSNISFFLVKKKKECLRNLEQETTSLEAKLGLVQESNYSVCMYKLVGNVGFSARRHDRYGTTIPETFFIPKGSEIQTGILLDNTKAYFVRTGEVATQFDPLYLESEEADLEVVCSSRKK